MANLKFKDQELAYQPFQDVLRNFDTLAHSKNIQRPFSERGFEDVLAYDQLRDAYAGGLSSLFKGNESYQNAFKSCVKHTFQEHANPFSQYFDANGNDISTEGYGAAAITGNYNTWTRLSPVLTAGYLARSRALELFQVINDDKPTFWREYTVTYVQKGLSGQRLTFPKAIRSGQVAGLLDLPLCDPVPSDKAPDNKNIIKETTDSGKELHMIKVNSTGNLMEQSQFPDGTPVDRYKHALERQCSIDYVKVKVNGTSKIIHTRIERDIKTGKTSERMFDRVLRIPYTVEEGSDSNKTTVTKYQIARVNAIIDLDSGNYQILSDGTDVVQAIHFNVRITNVANEMETYMNGQDKYILSFDVENKIYGSIPIIPEMQADYNAGGENVSWVANMTDQMTETYAGIRDNDLETFIDNEYDYGADEFELAFKLGGYKFNGAYSIIPRHPGGSDDIIGPQRIALKAYFTRIFTRAETYTNFDRNIERQWILMARNEDLDILPDISYTTNAPNRDGDGGSDFRYGFSLDDSYGYIDSFGRKTVAIGSKDERWEHRPIWAVQKSLTLAAPTTIYFPYMFRVFSGISPEFRNRGAMLFASRDAKRISTMVQARIQIEGNNLQLYNNSMAFAAGQTTKFEPVYTDDGVKEVGQADALARENIPDYIEKA